MKADHYRLREALAAFDGKVVAPLQAVADGAAFDAGSVDALLTFLENEEASFQVGATWLLLNVPTLHPHLDAAASARLFAILGEDVSWPVALHILQLFPHLPITATEAAEVHPLLAAWAGHKRPFVRAWAANALYLVADRNPQLRAAVAPRLHDALDDEKASVRARLRNATARSTWFPLAD